MFGVIQLSAIIVINIETVTVVIQVRVF